MDPAFPDIVGQYAAAEVDDRARVWIVERSATGGIEERLDPSFLATLDATEEVDEILEEIVVAAAMQDIAETRIW